jgi:3,4-dihydroxy-2-butanone 4-phosphate synthase
MKSGYLQHAVADRQRQGVERLEVPARVVALQAQEAHLERAGGVEACVPAPRHINTYYRCRYRKT